MNQISGKDICTTIASRTGEHINMLFNITNQKQVEKKDSPQKLSDYLLLPGSRAMCWEIFKLIYIKSSDRWRGNITNQQYHNLKKTLKIAEVTIEDFCGHSNHQQLSCQVQCPAPPSGYRIGYWRKGNMTKPFSIFYRRRFLVVGQGNIN